MLIFTSISFVIILYYYYKTNNEPLHPDSGEFIYPGIMQRLGFPKVFLQKYHEGKYEKASLSYDSFPPAPFSDIGNEKKFTGAFPHFRDKMFVWWFFEKLFKYFPLQAKQFRIINCLLLFVISNLFFLTIHPHLNLPYAIFWSSIFLLTVMLPHFDFYQIHAEEWGILLLLTLFFLLDSFSSGINSPVLYGIILVLIFFFIKITFAPTLLYFLLSPLIIYHDTTFFQFSAISLVLFLLILIFTFFITGKLKAVFWSINPLHLIKYKQGTSTSRSADQREHHFSIKVFVNNYLIEILIGSLALVISILWLFNADKTPSEIFLFGWICISSLEIIIQGKYYPSHMLMLTVPGILFIGLQSGVLPLLIALLIVIIWMKFFIVSKSTLIEKYGHQSQNPFIDTMILYDKISDIIIQYTQPTDRILAIGYCSPIYSLSRRKAALGIYEALTTIEPVDISKKLGQYWEWWLLCAILEEQPTLLIDSKNFVNIKNLELSSGIKFDIIHQVQKYNIYKLDYGKVKRCPMNIGERIFNI